MKRIKLLKSELLYVKEIMEGSKKRKLTLKLLKGKVDRDLGKVFYKNTGGFSNNLAGAFSKLSAKGFIYSKNNFSGKNLILKLKKYGYVGLGQPFDPVLINKISSKFNKLIDDENYSYHCGQAPYYFKSSIVYSRSLIRAQKLIPKTRELLNYRICNFLEEYFQSHFKITELKLWRNFHVPDDQLKRGEIYSNNWHCDRKNSSSLKMFVYLSNVSKNDGPLFCQSIERTKEIVRMGYRDRDHPVLEKEILNDPKHVFAFLGNAGTVLFCHTVLCLHKAGIPTHGHYRDILQYEFAPSRKLLPKNWYKKLVNVYEPIRD